MAQSDAHVQLADDPSDLTQENDTGRSCPVCPSSERLGTSLNQRYYDRWGWRNGSGQMNEIKRKNVDFFKREIAKLLANPLTLQKFVVIHNEKVQGAYDTFEAALKFAASQLPSDEFVIQHVVDESAVVNFHAIAG